MNEINSNLASLVGTDSETISIGYEFDSSGERFHCTPLLAEINLPNLLSGFSQTVETSTYSCPNIEQFKALLDGDSTIRFTIDSLNFTLHIYEHNWGVRSGFIAELFVTTILDAKFSPWPKRRPIGDYILDPNPSAACLSFAFQCEYEQLRQFHSCLSRILQY